MDVLCRNLFTLSGSLIVSERSTMTYLTDLLINWRRLSDRTLWCSWFKSPWVLTSNNLINPTRANKAATGQPKVTHFVSYEGTLSLLINDWTFRNASGCLLSHDWTCRFRVSVNTLSCLLHSFSLAVRHTQSSNPFHDQLNYLTLISTGAAVTRDTSSGTKLQTWLWGRDQIVHNLVVENNFVNILVVQPVRMWPKNVYGSLVSAWIPRFWKDSLCLHKFPVPV